MANTNLHIPHMGCQIMKEIMYCYAGDISGYKNIIENLDHADLSKRVTKWKKFVRDGIDQFELPRYNIFSDTVYAGTENNDQGLEKLIGFARYMMEKGIIKSFPIRGAISFGDVSWDREIPFGKSLLAAHNLAENQDWIGTSCCNNFHISKSIYNFEKLLVYPAPMKDGALRMHPVVSWNVPSIHELENLTGLGGLVKEGDGWKWEVMKKVQNTVLFSLYLKLVKAGFIKQGQGEKKEKMLDVTPDKSPLINPTEPIEHYINVLIEHRDSLGL